MFYLIKLFFWNKINYRNIDDTELSDNGSVHGGGNKNSNFNFSPSAFRSSISPSPKDLAQKIIQNVKKTYTTVSQSDQDDSSIKPESVTHQNDEIREESSGIQTEEFHGIQSVGMSQSNYSLLPDGIEADAVSALSNGDSVSIVEVMDRLGRMEELLTTIIQR